VKAGGRGQGAGKKGDMVQEFKEGEGEKEGREV